LKHPDTSPREQAARLLIG